MNLKLTSIFFILLLMLIWTDARAWEVDFSRRRQPSSQPVSQATAQTAGVEDTAGGENQDSSIPRGAAVDQSVDAVVNPVPYAGHSVPTEIVDNQKEVALPPPPKSYSKSLDGLVSHRAASGSWSGDATGAGGGSGVSNRFSAVDRQELVILNTGKGFVPSNVRLRQGVHYRLHVVNVNEDKKNVSFIMDAFNQHYATYYGQIKTFNLDPDKEGIFEFECPETSSSGKLVVFGPGNPAQVRNVSSEK